MKNTTNNCRRCGVSLTGFAVKIFGQEVRRSLTVCDDCYDAEERESQEREALEVRAYIQGRRAEVKRNYRLHALRAGMPPLYHAADMETLVVDSSNQAAVEAARRYLSDPTRFLLLHGDAGRGKTWLAAAIFRDLLIRGIEVKFTRSMDMLDRLRESVQRGDTRAAMDIYLTCPVLIIDDLAAERPTDWTVEQIYSLVDHRYSYNRGTVITSNAPGSALSKIFGARTMSRIKAAGDVIEIKGEDRRLTKDGS